MTTPNYDPWQITFYLSMLSNSIAGTNVPASSYTLQQAEVQLAKNLQTDINAALANPAVQANIGSDWTIVWGPAVFVSGKSTKDTYQPANAAVVFSSATQNRQVLAIAATDPLSDYDWLVEDFDLGLAWTYKSAMDYWRNNGSYVAGIRTFATLTDATVNGVKNVVSLQDTLTTSDTLLAYLKNLKLATGETITVTGHSLGGALSPTLALAMVDTEFGTNLTSLSPDQVQVYATAGATPGNDLFAGKFTSKFTQVNGPDVSTKPWQVWNGVLWNLYDVVPNAWTPDQLKTLKAAYDSAAEYHGTDALLGLDAGLITAEGLASAWELVSGPFTHLNNGSVPPFNSTLTQDQAFAWSVQLPNTSNWVMMTQGQIAAYNAANSPQIQSSDIKVLGFLDQVDFQHVALYLEEILGIGDMKGDPYPPVPTL